MQPALEVADVFRRYGEAYRRAHGAQLGRGARRVMAAIETCRTAALGGHAERCAACGLVRLAYNSCRNRHCPKCQSLSRAAWLAARQAELLPVPYFHVVFTVPSPVAGIALQNKAVVYAILCRAAAETLRTIAADPKHLGAELGVVTVLHTWGQNPLCCPRRWALARPHQVGRVSARLLPPGAGALTSLSSAVSGTASNRIPGWRPRLLRYPRRPRRSSRLRPPATGATPDRLGSLCQAAIRRPRAGARLSRSLHPSRRHRQQPARHSRRHPGQLPLEGLSPSRQDQGDDPGA